MDETPANSHRPRMVVLMTDSLLGHCFGDLNPENMAATRAAPEVQSPHSSPHRSESFSYALKCTSSLNQSQNLTVDDNYPTDLAAVSNSLIRTLDSVPDDLREVTMHSGPASPSVGGLELYAVGQEVSHVQHSIAQSSITLQPIHTTANHPSLVLPSPSDTQTISDRSKASTVTYSQIPPSLCGSDYGSHETISEIDGFSSSPFNAVAFDIASSPPSSSPSQIFSSSPMASSQASEPPDGLECDKLESEFFSSEPQIQPGGIPGDSVHVTSCMTDESDSNWHDTLRFSPTVKTLDAGLPPSGPRYLPVAFSSTDPSTEEVPSNDSETLLSLSSIQDPEIFEHASPIVLSCPAILAHDDVGTCPALLSYMAPLLVQSSQPAVEPLESDMLFNIDQPAPIESSLTISSPGITPPSSPLPRSSPPNPQLWSRTISIETRVAEAYQGCISVPTVGFMYDHEGNEKAASQSGPTTGKRRLDSEEVDADSKSSVQNKKARVLQTGISASSTQEITDPSAGGEVEPPKQTDLPNPKRLTIASQKQQHRKLTAPFRSPVLRRPKQDLPASPPERGRSLSQGTEKRPLVTQQQAPGPMSVKSEIAGGQKRCRTQRAATQFKSPLPADATLKVMPAIRLTPTIQAQERKLQILKRAVKVKRDGDEEILENLVKKWTEAGREVAWEVWDLVKDNRNSDIGGSKTKPSRSFEDGWGWNEKSARRSMSEEKDRNWGWDVVPSRREENEERDGASYVDPAEREDEEEKRQDTLGTMLMELGIALETLGWNEEEENFEAE